MFHFKENPISQAVNYANNPKSKPVNEPEELTWKEVFDIANECRQLIRTVAEGVKRIIQTGSTNEYIPVISDMLTRVYNDLEMCVTSINEQNTTVVNDDNHMVFLDKSSELMRIQETLTGQILPIFADLSDSVTQTEVK